MKIKLMRDGDVNVAARFWDEPSGLLITYEKRRRPPWKCGLRDELAVDARTFTELKTELGKRGLALRFVGGAWQTLEVEGEPGTVRVRRAALAFGRAAPVLVPGVGRSYAARYALRELDDVHASHSGISFEANPMFEYVNDRNYRKADAAERVIRQAQAFEPVFLLSDNPDAVNGPPIVDARGNVLGGNSRVMTLQRVFEGERAGPYFEMLYQRAGWFGLNPELVLHARRAVLVRELDAIDDPQRAITDFNQPGTAALSPAERAIADARRVTAETLDYLSGVLADEGEDATLWAVLSGWRGSRIIGRLLDDGIIAPQEKPLFIDARGVVTAEAKQRLTRLMIGRLFEHAADYDNAPLDLRGRLERIVAPLARVEDRAEWSLTADTRLAVLLLTEARGRGMRSLDHVVAQGGLFGSSAYSARAVLIAKKLSEGTLRAAAAFKQYAREAEIARGGKGLGFFEPPRPEESFRAAFGGVN